MKTDLQLKKDVTEELDWDPAIDAAAIGVEVREGVVTLSGHLPSYAEKLAAERAVSQLRGVTGVTNHIKMRMRPAPDDVVERIEAALRRHAEREAKHINVSMKEGTVTLSGRVDSRAQRLAAVGAAWSAPGVGAVVDDLELS
ncbi:BON domain-containing protein [Cupriavidus necator]|uniref:Transport-associated protein n=1 Tax=Cupriavidus pinatubonensis (strain JMP 134 / LMG 1197) TaxID=264198 RepID=Q473A7_CUPPJ|nr:BON domain-containing protein [Cupriavidus necator]